MKHSFLPRNDLASKGAYLCFLEIEVKGILVVEFMYLCFLKIKVEESDVTTWVKKPSKVKIYNVNKLFNVDPKM